MGMMTILIADDEPAIVDLVRFTLEDPHVQMPRLDGLEVCRQLRRLPECAHTRIVMLTAAAQAADRRRGIEAGADHYLTKPFSPLALLTLVRGLVPEASVWPAR